MSLPHYKLQTEYSSSTPDLFPVLLPPAEPPKRFTRLKTWLRSRKLLIGLQVLSVAASAALLWMWLDPTLIAPKPVYLLVPAITLAVCLFLFLLIALVKNKLEIVPTDTQVDQPTSLTLLTPSSKKALPPKTELNTEVNLEQWTSGHYEEILEDTIIADVFDDGLLAPDRLIFTVKVED